MVDFSVSLHHLFFSESVQRSICRVTQDECDHPSWMEIMADEEVVCVCVVVANITQQIYQVAVHSKAGLQREFNTPNGYACGHKKIIQPS